MPSPIGHALGGLIVGLAIARPHPDPADPPHQTYQTYRTYLTACAVAACAPDIDFLWGRHSMETHSVFVAIAAGVLVWIVTRRSVLALGCALAWASHVLFDWLGSDDTPPLGLMALWPLTSNFYFAHAYVFEAISRRYADAGFLPQNVWAVTKEILILVPPAAWLWWWRHEKARRS